MKEMMELYISKRENNGFIGTAQTGDLEMSNENEMPPDDTESTKEDGKDNRTLAQVFVDKLVEDTMNPLKAPLKILTSIIFGR